MFQRLFVSWLTLTLLIPQRALAVGWLDFTVSEQSFRTYLIILTSIIVIVGLALLLAVSRINHLRREVQARVESEGAMRNNQIRLLDSQRIAHVGSWEWEPGSQQMLWTDEVFRIFGLSVGRSQYAYTDFLDSVHLDDRVAVKDVMGATITHGSRIATQFRIIRPSGEVRHVDLQGQFKGTENCLTGTVQDITDRKWIELFFRGLTEEVAHHAGEKYFDAMVAFLARSFGCEYAFLGVLDASDREKINTLSVSANGLKAENFSYSLENSPCEEVIDNRICFFPNGVQKLFPLDPLLKEMNIESYAGIPLYDSAGRCAGLVVLLAVLPLQRVESICPLLQIAASRVASELQRQSLEQQLQLTASVFENTREGILISDSDGRVVTVNQGFTKIFGYLEIEAVGMNLKDLFSSGRHDEKFYEMLWWSVSRTGTWHGEIWNRRKNGEVFPCLQSIESVKNAEGDVIQYISVFTDITEQKRSEERIQYLAHYDVLTNLPNRILFNDRLKHAIERASRQDRRLGMLFIDLDRFKYVNDTLGHQAGDCLLKNVAERLINCVRQADTVARLGGDEFTVLLEEVDRPDMLAAIAEKILLSLSSAVQLNGHQVVVGCSIGLSVYPDDGACAEQLLKHADTAMYYAKENGRNTYAFYSPELSRTSYEHLRLENELRHAVEQQHLLLYYQPQLDVGSNTIMSVEALVRWQPPGGDLVPPDQFIPLAEETGLIIPLGDWVLNSACAQAKQWLNDGLKIKVAVNISGMQVMRNDFVNTVESALEKSGLPASLLELEVTESYIMDHMESVVDTLEKVRQLGITLTIDDFGTGYSSLTYLKQLPIDVLKIDRSFISGIPHDHDDEKIAAAIIAMAKNLNLKVVAEGVETHEQLMFLEQRGCELAQGYFIARPMPATALERFITGKRREIYAVT